VWSGHDIWITSAFVRNYLNNIIGTLLSGVTDEVNSVSTTPRLAMTIGKNHSKNGIPHTRLAMAV
jgi:hypothetical protein